MKCSFIVSVYEYCVHLRNKKLNNILETSLIFVNESLSMVLR